jgi:peptidoglycan/xylan/chitin deacetylase (PgdA/CDA1 family)
MPTRIPILTYHSLDDSGSVISVPPAIFARQMHTLRDRGWRGIRLIDLIDAWDGKATLPPKPVVLTFDDAFANLVDHALPVLGECGFTATIFAVADYCGKTNAWPTQPAGTPILPLMTDAQLRDAAEKGMEIGSHTLTHPFLAQLDPTAAQREMADAQSVLQDRLGLPIQTLAYPYGSCDAAVAAAARSIYRAACTVEMNVARPGHNRWRLPRLDMYYWRNPNVFNWFGTPMGRAYLTFRRLGRAAGAALRK